MRKYLGLITVIAGAVIGSVFEEYNVISKPPYWALYGVVWVKLVDFAATRETKNISSEAL